MNFTRSVPFAVPSFAGWRRVAPYVAIAALPVVVRLFFLIWGGDDWRAVSAVWTGRSERLLAFVFLLLCSREFWLSRVRKTSAAASAPASVSEPEGHEREPVGALALFCIFLPMILYVCVYSWQAYAGMYLGDQDFTNISTALNRTARGQGLLPTPYVDTGPRDTFLAHHFAPALLVFVPFYWLAAQLPGSFAPTHFIYALLLAGVLIWGLWSWTRIIQREVPATFAPGATAMLALAFPLWRLSASFHFELLVLPAAALVFGARRKVVFWSGVALLLLIKEDMAVYLACYGLWLVTGGRGEDREAKIKERRRGLWLLGVCVLYFGLALTILNLLGDDAASGLPWGAYWSDIWNSRRVFAPTVLLVAALGFIPLLAGRLFWLAVAPILLLHLFSFHPWHQSFTGHYVYSVLPVLLFAFVRGFARLPDAAARISIWTGNRISQAGLARILLYGALVLVAGLGSDDGAPPATFRESSERTALNRLIRELPPGACVQAAIPASPHVPLAFPVYPLLPPGGHRLRDRTPPYIKADVLGEHCSIRTILFAPDDPRPPYYVEEHLREFERLGESLGSAGGWRLRRLP